MSVAGCSGSRSTPPAGATVRTAVPTFSLPAGIYTSAQTVTITDATPGATIYYTLDGSTPTPGSKPYTATITVSNNTNLQAIATATGFTTSITATVAYTITPPAATPTFSLLAGTYTSAQTVTISDATPGATIYYTIDGSTPTPTSKPYVAPISVSSDTNLQAIAVAPGFTTSTVATAAYTFAAATPTISLVSGTYTSVQTVNVTDTSPGATIYYTTDGSTPSTSSSVYTGAITVSTTQSINVLATFNGRFSAVVSASYVINIPPASIAAYAGSGQSIQEGSGFAIPLQVQTLDSAGKPAVGAVVLFIGPTSGPSVTFSPLSCTTDSSGLCSVAARANSSVGTYTVTASVTTMNAAFTLTNTGLHSYIVTVVADTTAGIATNCPDQASTAGSANSTCSLRDALAAAALTATSNETATITFAQTAPATLTLANGTLNIPSFTTIQGATSGGGTSLTNLITIDGNNLSTVFTEATGVTQAALNNLTITHGHSSQVGGGIYMSGSLSVNNSTLADNQAASSGGGIANSGGILTVLGSTFAANTALSGDGGGLNNDTGGTVTVSNSTFFGNQAFYGGALSNSSRGTASTATISASTISGNTGTRGGGIYNLGAITVHSSIVNGNTPTDCGGIYCQPLWVYVVFAAATPTVVDSSDINIAFSDSLGNTFSQTAHAGPFSSPASLAATFGPYFYENHSNLDTAPITGQSFGNLLVVTPENGATLSPLGITNPGRSFTATQMLYPLLLSVNNNVSGATATQINLSPLTNNGGPTQTMLPLSGSSALCVISPSNAAGTDQRGQPRTASLGSTTCQDAGSVQTSN